MEKKNKTTSALKKTADILRRNTKSRLAIQKFLNDLQEQESEYLNENKQITQCVFLGALCLKPVPADIFEVTLQPISFTTHSKSGILYNNTVKKDTNSAGHGLMKSEDKKKIKVTKTPRKNSKTSTIETNVFIGNICEQKPGNRILELFNNRHLSATKKVHSESSKVKLNGKNKKDNKIKYKIKVGGILRKNKKVLSEQKQEKLQLKSGNKTFPKSHLLETSSNNTQIEIPKIKSSLRQKFLQPETREVRQCKVQIKKNNSNVNNIISPLFVEGCKSIERSSTDNTIERLKKKRGIEIKKITKMDTKSKTIPSLVSVKSIVSENGPWNFINKTETGHPSSIINSFNGSNKPEQRISFVKEGSIDLLEIIDDEIEDYLEIDQNIVADLEALIPEEEIESISNTLISSTKIPNTASNNSESKSFATLKNSLNESKIKQLDKILLVNTYKSIEMVEDNDFNKDIEINENVEVDSRDKKNISKISVLGSSAKRILKNNLSGEHSKISKQQSEDILAISNKRKGNKRLGIECEESKHNKRVKLMQSSPRKLTAKFKKHSNDEPKIDISKKIRKITDFLFPIKNTDDNFIKNSNFKNVSQKPKNSDEEDSKNMTVVFLNKAIDNVSSHLNKESLGEMRTLRSCSKKSQKDDDTKIKTIGLTTVKDTKAPVLSPENEVVFICKNDENTEKNQKIITDNEGFSLYKKNVAQSDEHISKISPALSETITDISDLSIQNPITAETVQIRNLNNKTVKNCKPKKKKLIESKKINVSKIEKRIDVDDKLQSGKKIDSEIKLGTVDFPKKVEIQFNSNEDHDKAQKLSILYTEPIFKDIKEVHSKLENDCKKRRKEGFDKNSGSPEGVTNYKKTKSEVTLCDKSEVIVEKTVQATKIISEDKIESEANVVVKQCHPNEYANMSNPISKTRTRRETAARTQKIDGVADIHKDAASTIKEACFIKADSEVIGKTLSLENGKSKDNTLDSINLNSLPLQSSEEPSDNILKVHENFKITNRGNLQSVNSNQLGEPNSSNDEQDKIPPCKQEVAAISNHNETILQVESSQKTTVPNSRFQLRRKKTEVPNENNELKKPKHFEHNTHPIEHENLTNRFIELKNQSALSSINNECGIVENNPNIFDIKEDNLKTNVFRNTRRNKIGNENSNIISLEQSDKKMQFKEKELKGDIKQLCGLEVKGNKKIANNKTTFLRKKIQQETKNVKIIQTRNQLKGGGVLKRITNLRKGCRQKIVEQNKSIEELSKSDENITGMANKKANKDIKPTSIEMQSSAVDGNEEESLGKKSPILHGSTLETSINERNSCDTIKTSDSENSHSKVALIVEHNNEIENINNNNKKYTFRNRKSIVGRKTIMSKIHNVVNKLTKPKIISKSKHSLNSLLNNDSKMKSNYKHQLNENKIQVTSTNAIVDKAFMKEDMLELSGKDCSQGFLNESEINKRRSGENELHSSTNIVSSQNLASSVEVKLTEIQSDTVAKAISKPRTKKASTKSLSSESQNNVGSVKQKNKVEEFSTDTDLDALSKTKLKTKNQRDKEKIGPINEDELLSTENKSDILHEEKSKEDILKKFNEENEIACYIVDECGISHKNNERKEKINNQLVKETFSDVQSTSPENKNLSLKNVSQKREHDKSSDSAVHIVSDISLGILQEKINMDHSGFCKKEFQHKAENTLLSPSEDKNHSKAESPVHIVLSGASKIKSRQKPTSKRLPAATTTKSENKGKLKTQKDEKSDTINAVVDTSPEIVGLSDQKLHTFATENIKNDTSKTRTNDKSAVEIEAPVAQTQKSLDSWIFERTGTLISPDGSSIADIAQKKLQFTNKNKSITLDKTLNESQLLQQNENDDSQNSVPTTKNVQECENFEKIVVEGVTSESRNNEVIPSEEPIEQNNDLQHPESHSNVKKTVVEDSLEPKKRRYRKPEPKVTSEFGNNEVIPSEEHIEQNNDLQHLENHSSNVKKTVVEDSLEPKKRRYRKSQPKDKKMNIRQVTRKRKNNMVKESNENPKIEAGVLKLPEAGNTGVENNSNIPFVLKEDLSNPNSELSQEIERRMQIEFNREFPNYGPSAPERYRRIYRCRICLLVCETYGKLKLHRRIHDVATPYQCQQCDNSYDDVEDLAAHLRIHKGKMPYPCKKCDSSFWTSLQLERHQLVHVLKKVPPANNAVPKKVFKCEVCSKEFKKICDLERHTRVHTGEKPSVCNICNKRFQQAYNLHKHLLTHTQEKNYECIICQKRFGRSDVLNRHVLTHSIDKPFHCSICLKTFIRSSQLKLHLRKHHGMNTDEADKAVALATPASSSQEECPTPYSNVQDNKDPVPCTSSEQTEVCAF
ncbi:hypothetical protein WA026_016359 [Henosepilachna vigintioctopunctata]|uniref:C2H2-type domain-containing protein n=1 Tax=Henosepilachna vigintioctopunctata TaxID=420089 RepID=A0AAW1UK51_9CUCU